jgi:hypothetical protein
MNANDSAAFIANFAADSIVHDDEGHEHRGTAADTWQFFPKKNKVVLLLPLNPSRSQDLAYTLKKASPE